MFHRARWLIPLGVLTGALILSAGPAGAQAKNPCNPCGPKNPSSIEKGKATKGTPVNPCHAKEGTVFYVSDPKGRNVATFTSEAPLEDIVGTSNQISGYIVFDPSAPKKGGRGIISVPTASIDTGIPLRDEHLRSAGWLDSDRYPDITYEISGVRNVTEVARTPEYQTYDLALTGKFTLLGRSKNLDVPARITYMKESEKTAQRGAGDLIAGRATFQVRLSDHGVTGPKGMAIIGAKVSDTPSIHVRFVASSKKPSAENPCSDKTGKAKDLGKS